MAHFPPSLHYQHQTLYCQGDWIVAHDFNPLLNRLNQLSVSEKKVMIDTSKLSKLDTVGAWILSGLIKALEKKGKTIGWVNLHPTQASLLALIEREAKKISDQPPPISALNWVARLGKKTLANAQQSFQLITFLGELSVNLYQAFRRIWQIQWRSLLNVMDEAGYQALGIVGLLSFLIGIVIAYQMGQQLKTYGANIYIVSFLGVGILQEFGPLITAIIVAGRTSSAFTAQIGTMQVNQEIDALSTMGLSPIHRLVIPKILGLILTMPLLILWADIFGVFGGMIVAKSLLGISFYHFLSHFPDMIALKTLFNGLIKAPIFAVIIATIGCFEGFNVSSTADSIGRQTTKSVVKSIFLIIVADAIFSLILPWQNL